MRFRYKPSLTFVPLHAPPAQTNIPSVLAFSLAKAGSTLLYDILRGLAPHAGLEFYSTEDELFRRNIGSNDMVGNIGSLFNAKGYCYGGFRQFPAYPIPILHLCRTILLVRDPRDMAVSLYYSLLKSHVLPEQDSGGGAAQDLKAARASLHDADISDWAERSATVQYTRMFEGYVAQGFMWRPNVAIFRYEDVIFQKSEWITDICEWFEWDIPGPIRQKVAAQFDIRPDSERPDQHIRQVTPGNHRQHLTEGAVAAIEGSLGQYMKLFGYGGHGH